MTDWVVGALIGLGNEPEEAENIALVFRSLRTMADPDALQVFLGLITEVANQAEAKIDAAQESADRMAAAHLERCQKVRELQAECDSWIARAERLEAMGQDMHWEAQQYLDRLSAAEAARAAAVEQAEAVTGLLAEVRDDFIGYVHSANSEQRMTAKINAALVAAQPAAAEGGGG